MPIYRIPKPILPAVPAMQGAAPQLTPPTPNPVTNGTIPGNVIQALAKAPATVALPQFPGVGSDPALRYIPLGSALATDSTAADTVAAQRDEATILNRAQRAGLDANELTRLKQILDSSPNFAADAALLKQILPANANDRKWANPDRALRTFMDLDELRRARPDRITPDVVKSLVEGVAHSKNDGEPGADELEGVLGEDASRRAAQALIAMPQGDYNAIHDVLSQAGSETERALILKAVSARAQRYEKPNVNDARLRSETGEIQTFADEIRGMDRPDLIARTTVVADGDTLEQRFYDSCSATAAQMTKAEADPIYAWSLHNEAVHSDDLGGSIAAEQAELMEEVKGKPVTQQTLDLLQKIIDAGGLAGAAAKALRDQLVIQGSDLEGIENKFVSDTTGRDYHSYCVNDDATSRTAAADYIAKLVSQGVDVPIGVSWENRNALNPLQFKDNGLSHALLITDVRGQGDNQVFVVADPGGATYEVSRADLIAGQDFGGGQGRLSDFLY